MRKKYCSEYFLCPSALDNAIILFVQVLKMHCPTNLHVVTYALLTYDSHKAITAHTYSIYLNEVTSMSTTTCENQCCGIFLQSTIKHMKTTTPSYLNHKNQASF